MGVQSSSYSYRVLVRRSSLLERQQQRKRSSQQFFSLLDLFGTKVRLLNFSQQPFFLFPVLFSLQSNSGSVIFAVHSRDKVVFFSSIVSSLCDAFVDNISVFAHTCVICSLVFTDDVHVLTAGPLLCCSSPAADVLTALPLLLSLWRLFLQLLTLVLRPAVLKPHLHLGRDT